MKWLGMGRRLMAATMIWLTAAVGLGQDRELTGGCFGGHCPLSPTTPERPAEKVGEGTDRFLRSTTVRVLNYHRTDSEGGPRSYVDKGSGALIQNQEGKIFVLTAAHLFADGTGEVSARFPDGRSVTVRPVRIDSLWDIALLALDTWPPDIGRQSVTSVPFATSFPSVGEPTFIAGFGSDDRFRITAGHSLGYVKTTRDPAFETLKTTGGVRRGDSGGPVVNRRNELIGVVWGTDGNASYATYVGRIARVLSQEGDFAAAESVKEEKAPESDESADSPADSAKPSSPTVFPLTPKTKTPEKRSPLKKETPREDSDFMAQLGLSLTEKIILAILSGLGITVPPAALVAFALVKWLRRRVKSHDVASGGGVSGEKKERGDEKSADGENSDAQTSKTLVDLHNEYAGELNDLYRLNGRNPVADATLGRLYDTALAEWESGSDSTAAEWAASLRRKIKKELIRIHSEVPVTVSETE